MRYEVMVITVISNNRSIVSSMSGARSNVCYYFNACHCTLVRMTNWLLHVVKTSASDSREMLAGVISGSIIFDHTRFMRIRIDNLCTILLHCTILSRCQFQNNHISSKSSGYVSPRNLYNNENKIV